MRTYVKQCLVALTLFASLASADDHKDKIKFKAEEVKPGIYMLMGVGGFTGGNIGLSIGEDGVVMIDDAMPSSLQILQDAIKDVTKNPIDFLINTHVHGDHTGNNVVMSEGGAHIVAHENLREHMLTKGISMGGKTVDAPKAMLPVVTFETSMSFHLNNEDAKLMHLPRAHTDGDAIIHFKQANVVHTGDVFFNGMFPFIDLNSGGSVKGYLAAQKAVLNMTDDNTKIIPGHGPLATKVDLAKSVSMLEDSIMLVKKAMKGNKSEDDVVKMNPLKKYHDDWNWGFITTERMTRQLYKGLSSDLASNTEHSHGTKAHSHSH
ncbi:MAG: MBL fold metallo-hydrolase [Gammaproteobacteria bacterium]|nr:MBL fold metallo-hydrolase [Gammaproteobacteria bacterium]